MTGDTSRAYEWLRCGVPLTLLLDLAAPVDSAGIAAAEGGSAGWLRG
jgi:hypothetical protein